MSSLFSNPIGFIKSKVNIGPSSPGAAGPTASPTPSPGAADATAGPAAGAPNASPSGTGPAASIGAFGNNMAAGATAFFGSASEGVSKLFSTVAEKKSGLVDELSSKFDQLSKLVNKSNGGAVGDPSASAGAGAGGELPKKERKKKERKPKAEGEGESSASEYGDDGAAPVYDEGAGTAAAAASEDEYDEQGIEVRTFMLKFVEKLFAMRFDATPPEQSKFEEYCKDPQGRLILARVLSKQHGQQEERVEETVKDRVVTRLAGVLRDCNDSDDYLPPALLLQLLFRLHTENARKKIYLYTALREQAIWQSMHFWSAAFDEALRREKRRNRPTKVAAKDSAALAAEQEFNQRITFNVLSSYTTYILSFNISKEVCQDFAKKQADTYGLKSDLLKSLRNQIQQWEPST